MTTDILCQFVNIFGATQLIREHQVSWTSWKHVFQIKDILSSSLKVAFFFLFFQWRSPVSQVCLTFSETAFFKLHILCHRSLWKELHQISSPHMLRLGPWQLSLFSPLAYMLPFTFTLRDRKGRLSRLLPYPVCYSHLKHYKRNSLMTRTSPHTDIKNCMIAQFRCYSQLGWNQILRQGERNHHLSRGESNISSKWWKIIFEGPWPPSPAQDVGLALEKNNSEPGVSQQTMPALSPDYFCLPQWNPTINLVSDTWAPLFH